MQFSAVILPVHTRGLVWSHNPPGSQIIAKKKFLYWETTGGVLLQRIILSRWVYYGLPPMIEP